MEVADRIICFDITCSFFSFSKYLFNLTIRAAKRRDLSSKGFACFIFNPSFGLLNGVLEFLGLSSLIQDWLGDKNVVMAALVAPQSWMYVGFYMVLFISAIQSIPEDYYEAATLDGAGQWRQLFNITVPLVWGTFRTALIHFVVNAFEKTFALVRVVTTGGPNHASEVMTTYLYDQAFKFGHYGYGSAIGVILFVVIALVSLLVMKLTKRDVYEF